MTEKEINKKIASIYAKAKADATQFVSDNVDHLLYDRDTIVQWGRRKFKIESAEISVLPPLFGCVFFIEYKCRSILKTGKPGKRIVRIGHKQIKKCQPNL